MTTAVYAFSGDPITFGHIDVVERVAKAFDKIVVAIGQNPKKKYTFNLEDRFNMAKQSLGHIKNVEVECFHGLLVDFAYKNGISVIIRGVRNIRDMTDESELFYINISQNKNIDTFFVPASTDKMHISSSAAKGLQQEQGFLHEYVPLCVKQKLEGTMSLQRFVGITGAIGCGKSYFGEKFEEHIRNRGYHAENIDLDEIGHDILNDNKTPLGKSAINEIERIFGKRVLKPEGTVDRKALGDIVFDDSNSIKVLNEIMREPILNELRQRIYKKQGIIFINAALIAEGNLGYLCNNNIILVNSSFQKEALMDKGMNEEQITRRMAHQFSNDEKFERIDREIKRTKNGKLWVYENELNKNPEDEFEELYAQIIAEIR